EAGQLASSQDRSKWRDQVQDTREEFAGPQVVRPFVDRLIAHGILPTPDSYEVRWPTVQFMDENERANVVSKLAAAHASFGGEPLILPNELRDLYLLLPPLDEDFDVLDDEDIEHSGFEGDPFEDDPETPDTPQQREKRSPQERQQ